MSMTIAYVLQNALYLNITNRCTNQCDFCIRNQTAPFGAELDLWLDREPTYQEILDYIAKYDFSNLKEIVFCGYGEPLIRLETVVAVSRYLRSVSTLPIRINTNGQANLYYDNDITSQLHGLIDTVSISLNASNAPTYQRHCNSNFGEEAFAGILDFATCCKLHIPNVIFSVVDILEIEEMNACRVISDKFGVTFRVRKGFFSR